MALNVTGGNLEFVATLETDQLEKKAKGLENTFAKVSQNADKSAAKSQNLFASVAAGIASIQLAEKAFDFLGDAIDEALDAEESTARFRNTLESINRADAFDRLMDSADRLAQKFTYLDNDEVVAVFNKLVTYGKLTEKQMNDLLPVIINFSAKQRISIEQGSSIIIKALEGNTRSLKEYGINMKSTATETQRLQTIMTQLKGKVDGAGEAFQNTVTGGVASARQEFKNLQEDIGGGLLPLLNKTLSFINKAIKGLRGMSVAQQQEQDNEDIQVQGLINQKLFKIQENISAKIINPKTGKPVTAEDYIKALQDAMPKQDALHKRVFEGTIVALSKDKLGLEGVNEETKKVVKSNSELNSLLNERKSILGAIKDIQNDSVKTGLTDEERQLKEVADRYDTLISRIDEYNKKASKFGKPSIDTTDVVNAKQSALDNTRLKQDAQKFKDSLQDQQNIFEQYENAKKEIGVEKANEMFKEQTKGYTSYLNFLKSEAAKIAPKVVFGVANIGDVEKMKSLTNAINQEEQKNQKELFNNQIENFKRLFVETASFNKQRLALEKQYEEDVLSLKKNFTGKDLEERLQVLKEAKDADLKNLAESIAAQTSGYRALHKNIVNFTKERIQQEINALQKLLEHSDLDEQTRKAIKDAINQWKVLASAIDGTDDKIKKFTEDTNRIAGIFSELSQAVRGVNSSLADSLGFIGQMLSGISNARAAWDKFSKDLSALKSGSGNILDLASSASGVITAGVSIVQSIVSTIKQSRDSRLQALRELADFQTRILAGELDITQEYRERARIQATQNKTTLQALEDQKKLLEDQSKTIASTYNDIFKKLQNERFVISEKTKKTGGSAALGALGSLLGFGKKTEVEQEFASLANKTFEEIEKLYKQGRLTDNAKVLFEELNKIKQEGVDVNALLEENKRKAQEIFTGTTAESIVDVIASGFAQGKRSIADFAGDFEELMRQAMINSLKFKFLEPQIKAFFEEFAAAAESGNQLTGTEIDQLKDAWKKIISDTAKNFDNLQKVAGINFSSPSTQNQNVLVGQFRQLSEDTGNLLAGQFGGMRIAQLQLVDLQKIANDRLNNIETNTANTVFELKQLVGFFNDVSNGVKKLSFR